MAKLDLVNFELRGYEVAKLNPITNHWDQVMHVRPTERGRIEAVQAAEWLQDRHPKESYRARPIVSMEPKEMAEQNVDVELGGEA